MPLKDIGAVGVHIVGHIITCHDISFYFNPKYELNMGLKIATMVILIQPFLYFYILDGTSCDMSLRQIANVLNTLRCIWMNLCTNSLKMKY